MSAVEEIQAAIVRLSAFKKYCTSGTWQVTQKHLSRPVGYDIFNNKDYVVSDSEGYQGAIANIHDAVLIVTLHKTIDAQLAILREVLFAADVEHNWDTLVYTNTAIDLARAINEAS